MSSYVSIVSGMLLLPVIYALLLIWYRADFKKPENQQKKPLASMREKMVLLLSEAAVFRMWYTLGMRGFSDLRFTLLYIMLAGMTVLCMTDYWEQVVPNKILLILLLLFVVILGVYALRDMDEVMGELPSVVLGLIFCAFCFGVGYMLSRRSMGAGDVKLSMLMGLYLTGEYVVGAVLYGCLVGAAYSIIQLCRKKLTRKDVIPFVPFLYAGVIIRYLLG